MSEIKPLLLSVEKKKRQVKILFLGTNLVMTKDTLKDFKIHKN